MSAVEAVAAGVIGACVGSFALSVARRWDAGGAARGRSRCEACAATLGPLELVPLVSWLVQRGRCRHCGATIAPAHVGAEIAGAGLGIAALLVADGASGWLLALLGWWLLTAALIDLRHLLLPDALTLPLVLAGLARAAWGPAGAPEPLDAALGAVAGFVAFWALGAAWRRWRGRDALGLGDAKLYAAAGAWLGAQWLPQVALLAASAGIVHALLAGRSLRSTEPVPFGPSLAAAFWLLAALGTLTG